MLIEKDNEAFYLQCSMSIEPKYLEAFFSTKRFDTCECLGFIPMEVEPGAQGVIEPTFDGKHYVMVLRNQQNLVMVKGIRRTRIIMPDDFPKVLSGDLRLVATGTNNIRILTKAGNVHSV